MGSKTRHTAGPGPDVAQALARGQAFERAGQIADAIRVYRGILAASPRQPQARTRLGTIALNDGDSEAALGHFEKAAKANQKNAGMRANVATVHLRRLEYHKAIPHLKKALALDPGLLIALRNLGECLFMLNDLDGARRWLEKALTVAPDNADLQFDLGRLERATGNMAAADTIYRKLIAAGTQVSKAYSGLAATRKFTGDDPELDDIEMLLKQDRLARQERQNLAFSAGKMAADRDEYERAFGHFETANANYESDPGGDDFAAYIEAMKAAITPDFFRERADFAAQSDRPVFIFGMPRSGTSLVEQILASHPQFDGADELPFFNAACRQLGATVKTPELFAQAATGLTRRDARRMSREYLDVLSHHSRSARRVSDKLPHNFERLWLLALLFPNAAFIHCRRNPVATCVSCYTNPLNEQHAYATDLRALGRYYRLYDALMDHWQAVLPVPVMECEYEAVIADPENLSRKLVAHVGLPWHDDCLSFHENRRAVRTLSGAQVRQPVYQSARAAWRHYEAHLEPLMQALGDLVGGGKEATAGAAGTSHRGRS